MHLWGRNHYGECGEKPEVTKIVNPPKVVKSKVQGVERQVVMVACGGFHTLLLNQDNDVCAMGRNDSGQLGLSQNEYEHQSEPMRCTLFTDKVITEIAAGSSHSVALTVEGYAYSWGGNSHGQLAQGSQVTVHANSKISMPKIIENLLGRGICHVVCKFD